MERDALARIVVNALRKSNRFDEINMREIGSALHFIEATDKDGVTHAFTMHSQNAEAILRRLRRNARHGSL